jgi:pyridoxal phosphate enzyme (YggS family)
VTDATSVESSLLISRVSDRLADVRARIASAAAKAGRMQREITLVAVSKTHPVEALREAIDAGVTAFGENRVQEAIAKVEALGRGPEWHLIGSLQTNKARQAVAHFDVIHSLDRVDLGRAISKHALALGTRCRVLVQVNVTGKDTQGGVSPDGLEGLVRELARMPGLRLDGLMCIAPEASEVGGVEGTRPSFQLAASKWGALAALARDHGHTWHHLSMGMTNDFEVAIEHGATVVRVGRAIFGDRST